MHEAFAGSENSGYQAFMNSAQDKNNIAWISSIKTETGYSAAKIAIKAQEVVDKNKGKDKDEEGKEEGKEGEKQEEGKEEGKEDKPKERGIVGIVMKLGDKARESNEKAMGFHDKGNAVSRRANKPVFEQEIEKLGEEAFAEENENEVENENHGTKVTEEDLREYHEEKQAEEAAAGVTNFRAQEEEAASLEQQNTEERALGPNNED
jgi:hypothetical protein